ncbi:MAG: HAD-IA family hydrolase, partial [Bacteroidota bacterium]
EVLVQKHPEWEREIRMYYDRWTEAFPGAIQGTVDILKTLHDSGNYRLLALTNWSAELFPWAKANYPFLELFESIMVSGEVKMKKPDPEIYELLRTQYNLGNFSGCVFTDDSLRNVEGAIKAGLDSIHFQDPNQLRNELIARGIQELG